jgi:hypothetical protein
MGDLLDPQLLANLKLRYGVISKEYPVTRVAGTNKIAFSSLRDTQSANSFIYCLHKVLADEYKEAILDFSEVREGQYPNACVPIAAIIQFYKKQGINFLMEGDEKIFPTFSIEDPRISTIRGPLSNEIFSTIWKFERAETIYKIVERFVMQIGQTVECSSGVLHAIDWCLNEVMDNVLQHSESRCGYVMAQFHPQSKKMAICIADTGVGIFGSLSKSKYAPQSVLEAIDLAVQEGVTRDSSIGQGNGLWGLLQIVLQNKGSLSIRSGEGCIAFTEGGPRSFSHLITLGVKNPGTIIDFQLDVDAAIDVGNALNSKYTTNFTFEKLEDDRRVATILLKDFQTGHGTRESGEGMRNLIHNLLKEGSEQVIIDFEEIGIVSSSFADECFGKLAVKLGMQEFQKKIGLLKVNDITDGILNKAIAQRILKSQSFALAV